LDRLIYVIPQTLRIPAAYPDLEQSPPAAFPTWHMFAGRDRLQGRAAYPEARKKVVSRDGIEPPTPGFSVLVHGPCKCA
jgi:hypothetical protein